MHTTQGRFPTVSDRKTATATSRNGNNTRPSKKKLDDARRPRMDPKHFQQEPDSCPYCKADLAADEGHLLWECATFSERRSAALGALEPQDKPPTLDA